MNATHEQNSAQGPDEDEITFRQLVSTNNESLEEIQSRQRRLLFEWNLRSCREMTTTNRQPVARTPSPARHLPFETQWMNTAKKICSTSPDFFKSREAYMKETYKVKTGIARYKGFPVSPSNCHDVNMIYKDTYLPGDLFSDRNRTMTSSKKSLDQQ